MQLPFSFQVYSDRYKNSKTLAARVPDKLSNPSKKLSSSSRKLQNPLFTFKATRNLQCQEKWGSVKDGSTFDIEYLKGSWRKEWKPWKLANGENWTDSLPNGCILLVDFHLDQENKITNETYNHLRKTYQDLERNQLGESDLNRSLFLHKQALDLDNTCLCSPNCCINLPFFLSKRSTSMEKNIININKFTRYFLVAANNCSLQNFEKCNWVITMDNSNSIISILM